MRRCRLIFALVGVLLLPGGLLGAQGCTAPAWEGRFYNNTEFADAAVLTTCVSVLDLDWGLSAPGNGVNADNFSVRWTSTQTFPAAGSYQFTVTVDGGVRLFINGTPLINAIEDSEEPRTLTATYNIPSAGATAFITLEMVSYVGTGQVRLVWALTSGGIPQNVLPPTPTPFTPQTNTLGETGLQIVDPLTATGGGQPWRVEYFNNLDFSGEPVIAETFPSNGISRNYGSNPPADNIQADGWSARWTRLVDFPEGVYTFTLRADDGARVTINDILILEQPAFADGASYTVAVQIPAGEHLITVEYFDTLDAADLFLTWEPPIGTTLLPNGCNGETAGINGSAPPCPEQAQIIGNATLTATVKAGPLYFRPNPNKNGDPYGFIHRGESYPAIGRSADNIWIQLEVDGVVGWSMTEFLTLSGNINSLAITDGTAPSATGDGVAGVPESPSTIEGTPQPLEEPTFTGVRARALGNIRLRTQPNDLAERIGNVAWGSEVEVIGRSGDGLWLQIVVDGVQGWSARAWYEIIQGDLTTVPITG
jgi:uncharacterized protein YraI